MNSISGTITVPGDKSISHRSIMIGALADGVTHVTGFLAAEDCISTMRCFESLGVTIERLSDTELKIHGVGLKGLKEPGDVLDVGNSGTTLRILPGILASQDQGLFVVLTGDASIRRRPTGRVVEPLRLMTAEIWGREEGNYPPLAINGSRIESIQYNLPVASAQVKTCLLLAALLAEGETEISEPAQSRDHTERMLELFGARIDSYDTTYKINGGQRLKAAPVDVPGDISSAAFFMVAASIVNDSSLRIENVGVNETRTGIIDALYEMGANILLSDQRDVSNEPRANMEIKSAQLKATILEGEIIPRLIDEIPIIAVAATQAEGRTEIRDARELRVKESDRIAALSAELRKMGAIIEELDDGMIIHGPTPLKGARVNSHGDHRIAMSLAVAALVADGETVIENSESIAISYPSFVGDVLNLRK
ncbi:3-phosphoshikimate 1-carboxyvinyltransferase [Candidatus Aquicultor secundus]|uniref:3-phosphoshikimate 1-carboxyvinyltransferase n=1 Tax=Candidatus Aquicultor secundus TaxID=1973895 RepID=UPI000CC55D1B|nr:MAG: 3-phosphoshikimate 1-carboxyvinyltransferase [Candidatus Aquicultor secundus]